ncbi:MAG: hypothetical protein ACXWMN_02110 [Candidatus Limnocylindria bacterium]
MVETTLVDVADADAESAFADVDEAEAHSQYRDAAARAAEPNEGPSNQPRSEARSWSTSSAPDDAA